MTITNNRQASLFDLQKSQHILKLEEEFLSLEQEKHNLNTELRMKKISFDKLKQDIDLVDRKISSIMFEQIEKVNVLKKEILSICDELLKDKKIPKAELKEIKLIQKDLRDHPDDLSDQFKKIADQEEINFDLFKDKIIAPKPEEQRNIRKVYLRLASKLHPDKAKNDQEKEHFHVLMGIINEAYQNHDIEALLSLENEYSNNDFSVEVLAVDQDYEDKIKQNIARLKEEVDFLKNQLKRINSEIRKTDKLPNMEILKDMKKNKRNDPFAEMKQEFEDNFKSLEKVKIMLERRLNGQVDESELLKLQNDFFDDIADGIFEQLKQDFGKDVSDTVIKKVVNIIMENRMDGKKLSKKEFAQMINEVLVFAMFEEMMKDNNKKIPPIKKKKNIKKIKRIKK